MQHLFLISSACAAINLGGLEPETGDYVYRQGAAPEQAAGGFYHQTVERTAPGWADVRSGMGLSAEIAQRTATGQVVRYGFLTTSARLAARGIEVRTDYSALPETLTMAPGESRSVPIGLQLREAGRTEVRTGTLTFTHLGCAQATLQGENLEVHRIELDSQRYLLENGEVRERNARTVFEIAPDLGWWVRIAPGAGAPGLVLVEAP